MPGLGYWYAIGPCQRHIEALHLRPDLEIGAAGPEVVVGYAVAVGHEGAWIMRHADAGHASVHDDPGTGACGGRCPVFFDSRRQLFSGGAKSTEDRLVKRTRAPEMIKLCLAV